MVASRPSTPLSLRRVLLLALAALLFLHLLFRLSHHLHHPALAPLAHLIEDPRILLSQTRHQLEDLELQLEEIEDDLGQFAKDSIVKFISTSPGEEGFERWRRRDGMQKNLEKNNHRSSTGYNPSSMSKKANDLSNVRNHELTLVSESDSDSESGSDFNSDSDCNSDSDDCTLDSDSDFDDVNNLSAEDRKETIAKTVSEYIAKRRRMTPPSSSTFEAIGSENTSPHGTRTHEKFAQVAEDDVRDEDKDESESHQEKGEEQKPLTKQEQRESRMQRQEARLLRQEARQKLEEERLARAEDRYEMGRLAALEEVASVLTKGEEGGTEGRVLRRVKRHFRRRMRRKPVEQIPPAPQWDSPNIRYSREQALLRDTVKTGYAPAGNEMSSSLSSQISGLGSMSWPSWTGTSKISKMLFPETKQGSGDTNDPEDFEEQFYQTTPEEPNNASYACSHEIQPIPPLSGINILMPEITRREVATRNQIMVSPRKDAFVHQENLQYQMRVGEETAAMIGKNPSLFPTSWEHIESKYSLKSCAVVGNSGILKHSVFGRAINTHDVVVRLNQAPTTRYGKLVGKKTTFRILNQKWADNYANMGSRRHWDSRLPLEHNLTLVISRSENGPSVVKSLVDKLRLVGRDDVSVLLLSPRFVRNTRQAVMQYRKRMCQAGYGPWPGGSIPSSGIVATLLLLQLCDSTVLYGFGEYRSSRDKAEYHYYSGLGSLKSGYGQHSWPAESALISQLVREAFLTSCAPKATLTLDMMERKDADHNLACGINSRIGVDAMFKVIAQAKGDLT